MDLWSLYSTLPPRARLNQRIFRETWEGSLVRCAGGGSTRRLSSLVAHTLMAWRGVVVGGTVTARTN